MFIHKHPFIFAATLACAGVCLFAACRKQPGTTPPTKSSVPEPSAPVAVAAPSLPEGTTPGESRDIEIFPGLTVKFQWVPSGAFQPLAPTIARPVPFDAAKVGIPHGFWMASYECTVPEWRAVMGVDPGQQSVYERDKMGSFAAEGISWLDCQEFLGKLTKPAGGWRFDLPTEHQWEFACRANAEPPPDSKLMHAALRPVGSDPPNPWGIFDLYGGVAEWCRDVATPGEFLLDRTMAGPPIGQQRVTRGGVGNVVPSERRAHARRPEEATARRTGLGFRLVVVKDDS